MVDRPCKHVAALSSHPDSLCVPLFQLRKGGAEEVDFNFLPQKGSFCSAPHSPLPPSSLCIVGEQGVAMLSQQWPMGCHNSRAGALAQDHIRALCTCVEGIQICLWLDTPTSIHLKIESLECSSLLIYTLLFPKPVQPLQEAESHAYFLCFLGQSFPLCSAACPSIHPLY